MEDVFEPFGSTLPDDALGAAGPSGHSATRYRFSTVAGMFCIELRRSGVWRVMFGRRELGAFESAQSALDVLLQREAAWPGGPRNASLGLPADLEEWAPSRKMPR